MPHSCPAVFGRDRVGVLPFAAVEPDFRHNAAEADGSEGFLTSDLNSAGFDDHEATDPASSVP